MKRLMKYVMRYKFLYLIPILSMLLLITLDMINPYLIQIIIDEVITKGKFELLNRLLWALLIVSLGKAVLGYVREFMFDYAGAKAVADIRKDLFSHIQTLSFEFFDHINTGEIMSRTTEDINKIWGAVGFAVGFFIEQLIYFVVAVIMMFVIEWRLALVCLFIIPPLAYLTLKLEKKMGEAYEKISDQDAVLNTTAQENIAGVRLVKAFGREKHEIMKFFQQNKKHYEYNLERARVTAKYHPKIEMLSNMIIVAVISIGGILVIGKSLSIGKLVAFNWYANMIIWPMKLLGWLANIIAQSNASSKKVFQIMDVQPVIQNPENPILPSEIKGHVIFDRVYFKYHDQYVLKDIHLNVKPGSTIAIMGATGSGKSSLVHLLGRYYDCTKGKIIIDGVDIKEMDLTQLRQNVSVVMQDTFLFSDTIEENIKFGGREITKEQLLEVSKAARVDNFVQKMEKGYDSIIGERGIGLSGGQKQRISIARALLKNSPIMILDDATSALDMETEYEIQKELKQRKGITKFIIAHRISAVKDADEIIILENGSIVERGNHQSLLWKKGRYYQIYCEQFKDMDTVEKGVG